MKVLLAINHPQLFDQFVRESGFTVTPSSDVCYFGALSEAILEDKPDVLVVSAYLYGSDNRTGEIAQSLYAAREKNVRVVLLAGSMDEEDELLYTVAKLGVYDIIFNPCPMSKIVERIKNPAGFSEAARYLKPHSSAQLAGAPKKGPHEKIRLAAQPQSAPQQDEPARGAAAGAVAVEPDPVPGAVAADTAPLLKASPNVHTLPVAKKATVVAVCSPARSGKTFVAVNLAAVAAKSGERACVLDLDFTEKAVYSWLNISSHPDGIYALLREDPKRFAEAHGITVYGADPLIATPAGQDLPEPSLAKLASSVEAGLIVLDMPRELSEWHMTLLEDCGNVVVVVEPDCHSYLKYAATCSRYPEPLLVYNKHVGLSGPFDCAAPFGVEPAVFIPLDGKVYDSLLFGRPLALSEPEIYKNFEMLYKKIKQRGRHIASVATGQKQSKKPLSAHFAT